MFYLTCYCPLTIIKKLVQQCCSFIGLEFLDDWWIFSGIVKKDSNIVCKHRRTGGRKPKYASLFVRYIYKQLLCNSCHLMWSHCRAKVSPVKLLLGRLPPRKFTSGKLPPGKLPPSGILPLIYCLAKDCLPRLIYCSPPVSF